MKRTGLARRRRAVGMTQEMLAEQLGVDRTTIIRWETGVSAPLPWHRPNLAMALKVSLEELAVLLGDVDELRFDENEHLGVVAAVLADAWGIPMATEAAQSELRGGEPSAHSVISPTDFRPLASQPMRERSCWSPASWPTWANTSAGSTAPIRPFICLISP